MRRLKHVVDLAFAVVLLYVSYWVYEISNFIAYSLAGLSPTISVAGLLPAGISAVVGQGTLLVKILQVLIACTVPIAVLLAARVARLPAVAGASITILSIFIATFYWEVLSSASSASLDLHTIAFEAVSAHFLYYVLKDTIATQLFNETPTRLPHVTPQ